MRPPEEVDRVRELARGGLNHCQIARATGIPRSTIRTWLSARPPRRPVPFDPRQLPSREYAYLLGIYLGDGTVLRMRKDVDVLHIFQDDRYPGIIGEIVAATKAVMPRNKVTVYEKHRGSNCVLIACYSKAWPLVFPQAGPGRKHERRIELTAWQWGIVWQRREARERREAGRDCWSKDVKRLE